ncbi:MAG: UDP-N-acetylmuramoyl-L-alanyl-D-glutamate--2,6-diaminopimelate ligase [Prochlorococcus marinus subsp. pastoris]
MRSIKLHRLLDLVGIIPSLDLIDKEINNISFNSKEVQKGTLFLGMPGLNVDGGKYCIEAIENGAEAAIIGSAAKQKIGSIDRERILVIEDNLDYIFGQIVAEFWNRPSRKLKLIGVTGTNGKTTITFLLEYLLKKLGKKTALFGTLFNRWPGFSEVASHTTDFADKLQKKLNAAVEAESEFAILEVSSHSIAQNRISGCEFEAAIFTNLTQDHLDYHSDMESYFQTKRKLFFPPYLKDKDGISVLNHDDLWISKLSSDLEKGSSLVSTKITKSEFKNEELFYVTDKIFTGNGCSCIFHTPEEKINLFVPLVGEFNLMNAIQAITILYKLNFSLKDLSRLIKSFPGTPGRMEKIDIENNDVSALLPNVIVDYAHTPDGLKKVLKSIKKLCEGKLITVFGCGGDRDSSKRPLMGSIAEEFSDYVFITSDNPRSEDPEKIVSEILKGIEKRDQIKIEIDRFIAIKESIEFAKKEDIILIAGKGHEDYQILNDKIIDFDDRKIAYKFLEEKSKSK